jgi:ABC-type transport system involved in multi-copper enzyme maturation permease subunit
MSGTRAGPENEVSPTLRNLLVTAAYEFTDAIRSRRAIVLFVIYFAGAMVAANVFIQAVQAVEQEVLKTLRVSSTDSVGTVTQTVWDTNTFRQIVAQLVGDDELAGHLVNTSPIALFYGWLSVTFAPLLMVLISTTRVAEEVGSGSARFVLFRTSLFSWCMGKYLGQALLLLPALLLSGAGAWLAASLRLSAFDAGPAALQILAFSLKAVVYTWTFLGLAIGVSQLTRSPNLATTLGLVAMIALAALSGIAAWQGGPGLGRVWDVVLWLTPRGHRMALWWPDLAHQVPAMVMLLALGFLYMLPGYYVMTRRDY